jgi:hypothetical protein
MHTCQAWARRAIHAALGAGTRASFPALPDSRRGFCETAGNEGVHDLQGEKFRILFIYLILTENKA